jgi:hypothetical protein
MPAASIFLHGGSAVNPKNGAKRHFTKPVQKEMGRDADKKENGDKDHGLQHREAP